MPSFRDIYDRMGGFRRREFRDQLERRGHSLGEHFYGSHDCADGIQDSSIRREAEYAYDDLKREERDEEERREEAAEQKRQEQAAQERRWEEERQEAEFLEEQRYEDERRDQEAQEER